MITTYDAMNSWLTSDKRNLIKFRKCLDRVFKNRLILIENEEGSLMITAFSTNKSNMRVRR